MKTLIASLLIASLTACAWGGSHTSRTIDRQQVESELARYLAREGWTYGQAYQYDPYQDHLMRANKVLESCKIKVKWYIGRRWNMAISEREQLRQCLPFFQETVKVWLQSQEVAINSLTRDPDRLGPVRQQPAPFYRERKRYENVKTDLERMMAALQEGLER